MTIGPLSDAVSPGWLLLWLLLTSILFVLVAGIAMGLPVWLLDLLELKHLTIELAAYLVCAAILLAFAVVGHRLKALPTIILVALVFVLVWHEAPRVGLYISSMLSIAMGFTAACITILLTPQRRTYMARLKVIALVTALIALASLPVMRKVGIYRALTGPMREFVETAYYPVQLDYFRGRIPRSRADGGGLALLAGNMVLMTGDGQFYLLNLSPDNEHLEIQPLSYAAPMNPTVFREQTPGLPSHNQFRAMDVLLRDIPGTEDKQVLVSHHYWYPERACFVIRVSGFTMKTRDFPAGKSDADWKTLFETKPCLRVHMENAYPFAGDLSGGRMLEISPGKVLVAVGDHRFNGVDAKPELSQDPESSFGKIIELDLTSGSNRIFSSGHRNPQGLYRDEQGRIWSTEHGPRGGDELNLLEPGANYGWPLVTLGTQYQMFDWPIHHSALPGQVFTEPAYSWIPSIGVSSLISIDRGGFSRWQGDLLVASLKAMSLFRIRLRDDRPVSVEPIPVYDRVRDILRDDLGRIIFWTDSETIGLLEMATGVQ